MYMDLANRRMKMKAKRIAQDALERAGDDSKKALGCVWFACEELSISNDPKEAMAFYEEYDTSKGTNYLADHNALDIKDERWPSRVCRIVHATMWVASKEALEEELLAKEALLAEDALVEGLS